MYSYSLALHYVRKRPIMLLGMLGVLLGLWSLTVVPGVFDGYLKEVHKHLRQASGELTLVFGSRRITFDRVENALRDDPAIVGMAPRLVWYGSLTPDRPLPPVAERGPIRTPADAERDRPKFYQVIGVDWRQERDTTSLTRWTARITDTTTRSIRQSTDPLLPMLEGEKLVPAIIVGQAIAENERLVRGDRIRLVSGTQRGTNEFHQIDQTFAIEGTFRPGFYKYEESTAFVEIGQLRRLLFPADPEDAQTFSEVSVRLRDGASVDVVRKRLKERLKARLQLGEHDFQILTWAQKNAAFLDWIAQQGELFKLVLFVLIVVSVLLIFVTLLMMVTEKTRDIGIISALGGTRGGVAKIFVLCALLISTTGVLLGSLLGWLTCRHLDDLNDLLKSQLGMELFPKEVYGLEHVPYSIDLFSMATFGVAAIGLSVVFALLPAWRAASFDPVRALRYD